MDDFVTVELEYIGYMAKITGKPKESIDVVDDVQSIPAQIAAFLRSKYAITQPVLILADGKNIISYIKAHKDEKIKDGTCFKVMPVISGG